MAESFFLTIARLIEEETKKQWVIEHSSLRHIKSDIYASNGGQNPNSAAGYLENPKLLFGNICEKKPGHLVNRIPRASIYYFFLFKSLSIKLTIFRRGGGDICCHSCHEM